MDFITEELIVYSEHSTVTYIKFDSTDRKIWKETFDHWKNLKLAMREYNAREPNFPEGLSEVAFCLWSGSVRKIRSSGSSSFDTFNLKTRRAEQVKACSVEVDLTSFGPTSRWDDLYFVDFWNNGKVDGIFDVYRIPNNLIYDHKVNATQTLREQQLQGRRPRTNIKTKIIIPNGLEPVASSVCVWK